MDDESDRISIENETEKSILNIDNEISDEESINQSSYVSKDNDFEEPITRQRVVLDFTPIEDLDSDNIQRKCCEFWDFVNNRPELEGLIAKPKSEAIPNIRTTKSNATISLSTHTSSSSINGEDKTAVSVLEFVEEKGLISRAFRSRMPTTFCEEELKDYSDEQCVSKIRKASGKKNNLKKQKPSKDAPPLPISPAARNMCQMLDEWDLEHPKSMGPPGPVPDLRDSKLNSQVFP